jgi:hypothetical protein
MSLSPRSAFFLTYGLLPLWAAVAFIVFAYMTMSVNHSGTALWALVVALPSCGMTLSIAGIALAIHSRTAGESQRKLRTSTTFVAVASFIVAAIGLALWHHRQSNEQDLQAEKPLVEQFVRTHPLVIGAAGTVSATSIALISFARGDSKPTSYEVSVTGSTTIYAIVDVDRSSGAPHLGLRCTTSVYKGHRDSHKDPCAK